MTKYKITMSASVDVTKEFTIEDGDDWEGRGVADRYDAIDLAYDQIYEEQPDLDWNLEIIQEIND